MKRICCRTLKMKERILDTSFCSRRIVLGASGAWKYKVYEMLSLENENGSVLLHSGGPSAAQFSVDLKNSEILILSTDVNGSLTILNRPRSTETLRTQNITRENTTVKTFSNNVAVLQQSEEIYALFFW